MKVTLQPLAQKAFAPVNITFTFESQEELDAFGSVFNLSPIANAFAHAGGVSGSVIYKRIIEAGGDVSKYISDYSDFLQGWYEKF